MRKIATILLSSMSLLFATSNSALSDEPTAQVFTGSSSPGIYDTYKVQVFQPSRTQPPADREVPERAKTVTKTTISYITYNRYETRAQRRKRALGHRYLGFIKQYSGYKYPF